MHWLGRIYGGHEEYPRDDAKAYEWLLQAAALGDAQSQCNLGVAVDYSASARWYRKAAKQGDEWACYLLGLSYREGGGVRRNRRIAAHWLKKAANMKVKEAAVGSKETEGR
jgi:TPR repeat protein